MEVDGKPGVVSRRHDRGRQCPQGQGEADLLAWSEARGSRQALQRLDGNAWRAIDLFEGDKLDERALKSLVRAAIIHNRSKLKKNAPAAARAKPHKSKK